MKYGLKIQGHFGDVLNITPIVKYISQKQGVKLLIETNQPLVFKNSPYVEQVYDITKGEFLPDNIEIFDCINRKTPVGSPKILRKFPLVEYWSYNLGFILHPKEKTLEFYPDPIDVHLPEKDYVVINPSVTDSCRTWDIRNWETLIDLIKENTELEIVVVGKNLIHNDGTQKGAHTITDPRVINTVDQLSLSQVWHYINNSVATITTDSGILHLAGTTDTNIIVLGSPIDPWYRMPYRNGTQDYKQKFVSGECKIFCQSDLKYNAPDYTLDQNWKIIDGFSNPGKCLENKSTFECHSSPQKTFQVLMDITQNPYKVDKSKISFFKNKLEKTQHPEKNELSLLIHLMYEHYNSSPSILLVGKDDILEELKLFYKDITLFDPQSLGLYNKSFDIILFNSNDFLTNNFLLFKTLTTYNTHSKSLVCIRNNKFSEVVRDISEYFKLDPDFSPIIEFNKEISTSIFIKEPNVPVLLDSSYINKLSMNSVGILPDEETLPTLFELIKGVNVTLRDKTKINISTIVDIKGVRVNILNKKNNLIYSTKIDIKPQINYWFSPHDKDYLNGFSLVLSKNDYIIYEKSYEVKNNMILK